MRTFTPKYLAVAVQGRSEPVIISGPNLADSRAAALEQECGLRRNLMERPVVSKKNKDAENGESRRNFLVKLGVGAAALAGVSAGLVRFGGKSSTDAGEFPGPDSIFHPASDPRLDPRRRS